MNRDKIRAAIMESGAAWTQERVQQASPEEVMRLTEKLMDELRPVLSGKHPHAVGPALAAMLAMWIAGNHPGVQQKQFEAIMETVRELFPHYSGEMWRHLLDA